MSADRIRRGIRLAVLALLLSSVLVAVASADPPPPSYRAQWAAPSFDCLNASDADLFVAIDSSSSEQGLSKRPPFLPDVSDAFYYCNLSAPSIGERYLVAIWYFDTLTGFTEGKDELHHYFGQHGTITPIVLNLSPEIAASSRPAIAEFSRSKQWQTINATRYESKETSGYAITFATNYFPGENYYIAYYGIVDPAELSEDTAHRLRLLATTILPVLIRGGYEFDPTNPMAVPDVQFNPAFWAHFISGFLSILFVFIAFAFIPVIVLSYITTMLALWMKDRVPPRTRVFLPPIVAGCLLGLIAIKALFVTEIAVGWTDLLVAAVVVPMGVLTSWPLFEGRLTAVRPKSAVFFCGAFTFFGIITCTVLFVLLGWTIFTGPIYPNYEPLWFIVPRSIVLRSGVVYLESVVLAIVLYSVILLWDRIKRRRQNHMPAEGEDQ